MSTRPSARFKCLQPRPMASLRLLCLPYAGGGASAYRRLGTQLPGHIEAFALQLPGREERLNEPPLVAWQAMMEALIAAVVPLPRLPTAIFGHSLGAVIGLELGRWMEATQPGVLRHLFAAARPWPGREAGEDDRLQDLPDDEFVHALDRRFGSLSTSLAHPAIREAVLPILRADLRLLASHRYREGPPLPCPVTVFAGSDDPVTAAADLNEWQRETQGPFELRMLRAGHFFVESHCDDLIDELAARLH